MKEGKRIIGQKKVRSIKSFSNNRLNPTKREIKVFKIASYDVETDTVSNNFNEFLFGGFIDSNGKYKCFRDKDKMIDYMCKHVDKDTMVFATKNSFDHTVLFQHKQEFLKDGPIMRGNLLINAKFKNINTFDTKAFTKASIDQLGLLLGIPKGSIDLGKFGPDIFKKHRLFYKARAYNKRDCEITREFMIGFQKVMNDLGGNLKMTIGSCAMDLFKRKYLDKPIQHEYQTVFSDGMTLKEFQSKGYHGGRTEMFKRSLKGHKNNKNKRYYYYDFNSLYPSVMLNAFPNPASCNLTYHKYGKLNINSIIKYEGLADCEVVIPYQEYGMLPTVVDHKLTFPVGKFRDMFTYIELRKMLSCGGKILKCYRQATYTKTITPFNKWVTDLYELRLKYARENNEIYKEIVKLLLNNLYGKFFQRNIYNMEFFHLTDRDDNDPKTEGITFDYKLGFGYRETPKESNQKFIIPIFAIYTTAYGRMKIYDKLVELEGLYCDTDSCLSEKPINTSKNLGDLKLEYEFDSFEGVKAKHYRLRDIINNKWVYRVKGMRLDKDNIEKEFNDLREGKSIKQMRFTSLKEAIRSGGKFRVNEKRFVPKKIDESDDKRIWTNTFDSDGLEISKPIILGFYGDYDYSAYEKLIKYFNNNS